MIEIPTDRGLAYAQYTHEVRGFYGSLIRVLPGMFAARPTDLRSLAKARERFWTFVVLKEAVRDRTLEVASHEDMPEHAKGFPVMRVWGAIDASGRVLNWFLWDGTKEWRIPGLTPEFEKLSIRALWDLWLLKDRVASNWSPQQDVGKPEGEELDNANVHPDISSAISSDGVVLEELGNLGVDLDVAHPVEHLLTFGSKAASDGAGKQLQERGYAVGDAIPTEDGHWLLTAERPLVLSEGLIGRVRAELEAIAREFDGEYDGWQAGVDPASEP